MQIAIDELMTRSGVGFGTSGARGLVTAMTDEVCYLYTLAFLAHLQQARLTELGSRVAVAGDLRSSTPRIMAAVIRAIEDSGYTPCYCGFIPSPAVALYGLEQKIAAIMVTGSHIPDDRNGIKFNRPDGEILKADEEAIRGQRVMSPAGLFDAQGGFAEPQPLPALDGAAERSYLHRYLDLFPANRLTGLRIGLYQHSSVARDILLALLQELGAEVVTLGRSDRFIPVDTEAIREQDVELARERSREYKFDALVSTDGDGDRPLVGDEHGNWLRGDIVGILTARYLGADNVVTPVSSKSGAH